jgi:glutamine amidotransferase
VFAHNGTIKDVDWLRAGASPERLAEIEGETDSELLFSWVLTRLDEAGVTAAKASRQTDRALATAARTARDRANFGAFNFLLSDGSTTYAHRFGRSMFLLEKSPGDAVVSRRESRDGTVVETPWSAARCAVIIASERINDEPWQAIEDGALLCIERLPTPHVRLVA